MEYAASLASLVGIWFLVVTIPGPNFAMVTRHSMSESRKAGLFIALGASTGAGIWALASLLGLNVIFEHAAWLYQAIRYVGAAYLMILGLKTIKNAFTPSGSEPGGPRLSAKGSSAFRRGLLTSFSNPKTATFFGSLFLAAFPITAPLWVYLFTIGLVFSVSLVWYSLVACFFSLLPVQVAYKKLKVFLDLATGSLFTYLGFRLAWGEA